MNDLASLRLCSGFCQMVGAAAAILSINNSAVIFNGPRWCALTAERELTIANRTYAKRLFCTEARQETLVYGVEGALKETLDEVAIAVEKPEVTAIMTSCSMSLIGDDIGGIAHTHGNFNTLLTIESGGLTGTFSNGYTMAFLELLKALDLVQKQKCDKVNLIGVCTCHPHWQGNTEELVRILKLAGIEVNVILGSDGTSLEEIKNMTSSALNIVLDKDLGLSIAQYLKDNYQQQYIVAEWPFGFKATSRWLENICRTLNIVDGCKKLEHEIMLIQDNLVEYCSWVEHNIHDYFLEKAVISMPGNTGKAFTDALMDSNINLFLCNDIVVERFTNNIEKYKHKSLSESLNYKEGVILLAASDRERVLFRNSRRIIYLDFGMPQARCCGNWICYVGVRGWQNFVSEFTNQLIGLYLMPQK